MKNKNYIWVVEGLRGNDNDISNSAAAYFIRKSARKLQREQREIGVKNTKIKKYIAI